MKKKPLCAWAVAALVLLACGECAAAEGSWNVVLRANDVILGQDMQRLNPRRNWAWRFDAGVFEVAVRKSAVPIPAPQCRMDYLILRMPAYYPENPKQASMEERRAVYDALANMKKTGRGGLKVRFEALEYWRRGPSGPELTTCNIYFSLPLDRDSAKILP